MTAAAAAGVSLIIAAERFRLPSIALLLVGGVLMGPYGMGLIDVSSLGRGLELVISLAVGVILFEGGMTLDLSGYRRAPVVIRRLLSIGVLVTWLGVAATVWLVFGLKLELSLLAGALVIVTGPTVISPILRRMVIRERLHHVLYWEGVLIDAVGVFVAVLVFDYIARPDVTAFSAIGMFALRVFVGTLLGVAGGLLINVVLKSGVVPDHHANIFALSTGIFLFGLSNVLMHESGLLTVVVAGFVLAVLRPRQLAKLRRFKIQLTELAIGLLFILLSAKLNLSGFVELGWRLVILLAAVLFVIRPAGIFLATMGQGFSLREKTFLSWLAPRGIVAASMASLFSLRLTEMGIEEARHLETFTYAIVGTTVILQGLTAPHLAKFLGLERVHRDTWMLVGERPIVAGLERALALAGVVAVSLDANDVVHESGGKVDDGDFKSAMANIGLETPTFGDIDHVVCLWPDDVKNKVVASEWAHRVPQGGIFRWRSDGKDASGTDSDGKIATIWSDISDLDRVSSGIVESIYSVEVAPVHEDDDGRYGPRFLPLFWVAKENAEIVSKPTEVTSGKGELAIVLRRPIKQLAGLIGGARIIEGEQFSLERAIADLLKLACETNPALRADTLIADLKARESSLPTFIGNGVAMPHAYSAVLEESVAYIGIVPAGVHDETPDGVPVRFVALVLSPADAPQKHLLALSGLAELATDADFVRLLTRQTSTIRVLSLLGERA
ncbi:MAG: NhaP-type Na+/H+ or K+/H+ antiporter/mannitol [Myxococcota bacterium]